MVLGRLLVMGLVFMNSLLCLFGDLDRYVILDFFDIVFL